MGLEGLGPWPQVGAGWRCGWEWGGVQSSPRDALAVLLPSQVAVGKAFLPREVSVGSPLMFPHLCSSEHPARQGSDGFKRPNAATLSRRHTYGAWALGNLVSVGSESSLAQGPPGWGV